MSKTSLNLIAILVFAMTFSVLLGPWLQISPYLPAIATAIVLGFTTLDTFTWQGQGGNLIIDWLASTSPEYRARIVRHEAGHFLVATLLEIPISGYSLSAWSALQEGHPGRGGVRFTDRELASQLQKGILSSQLFHRYGTIWMAGIAAEVLVYGNASGGAEDREKLGITLTQLGNSGLNYAQQERYFILQARTLLQSNWAAYEALVTAMEKRESVAVCQQIIQQHQSPSSG
ncbi:ATP-dependent Zn protease [Aerosakkonemataceae cyanobacterium BLCC-F154]|uniref:ATP-dependent Zn protease n=1 Tax=Floridaenema fluviatile BLCC-F154 TaxID=3153640 RepID=A0ABV4YJX6_9CYAN